MRRYLSLLGILLVLTGCDPSSPAALPQAGQWRLINYWALWCTPCREEIPELNDLDQIQDITVFGVNYDGKTGADLEAQRLELGITFPALATDPATMLGISRPRVLPTTLIVNPEGEWVESLTGPQTAASITSALARLGREKPTS